MQLKTINNLIDKQKIIITQGLIALLLIIGQVIVGSIIGVSLRGFEKSQSLCLAPFF